MRPQYIFIIWLFAGLWKFEIQYYGTLRSQIYLTHDQLFSVYFINLLALACSDANLYSIKQFFNVYTFTKQSLDNTNLHNS